MAPSASAERRDGPYLVARRASAAVALGERFEGQLRTAAWFTSSPNVWTAVTNPLDPLVTYKGRITALTATAEEFVAVGVDYSFGRSNVTVFTSTDGTSWRFRGGIEPSDGFAPYDVSEANGRIVIVGATSFESGSDGRIWVLDEGVANWSRVPSAPLGLDGPGTQVLTSIAWNAARGYVAGGSIVRGGREIPTLWRSSDGLSWTTMPNGTPPNDGRNAAVQQIVSVGNGFLASGASDAGPRLWRSNDATSWTALPPPPRSDPDAFLFFAASDGERIVLATLGEFGSQLHRRARSTWTRADTGSAFPRAKSATELVSVTAAGSRVVAVGQNGDQPLVMASAVGAWQRRPFSDRAGRLIAIAASRNTFWAAGWRLVHGRASMAVWTSTDARRWQRRGGTDFEPVGAFFDLAPVPGGFVAVALEPSKRGFVTTAWTLTKAGWRDEGVLGLGEPRAVCVGPHGVTAVAVRGTGVQSRIVVWTRTLAGRWPREPEFVASAGAKAVSCADAPSGTVVVGQDGQLAAALWRRTRPGQPWTGVVLAQTDPMSSIEDVVRDGSGFLATGSFGGRGQVDLAVWRSADGIVWEWLGGLDPVFTESGYQAGLGVVRVGERIVAVGRHGAGSAGLWVGPVPPTGGGEPGP
jgi:hypothetical protein